MSRVRLFLHNMNCHGMIQAFRRAVNRSLQPGPNQQERYIKGISQSSDQQKQNEKYKMKDPFEQIWKR